MRDHDELPYIVIEKHSGGGFTTFLWGALLGAGAALLLAPRSGEETQEEIRERVRRLREAAEDQVNEVRDTVNRTRDRLQDQIDNVRDTVESRTGQAREALETGRRAARDARSELERRVAEARESVVDALHDEDDDDYSDMGLAPEIDVTVTEVVVEEVEERPELG